MLTCAGQTRACHSSSDCRLPGMSTSGISKGSVTGTRVCAGLTTAGLDRALVYAGWGGGLNNRFLIHLSGQWCICLAPRRPPSRWAPCCLCIVGLPRPDGWVCPPQSHSWGRRLFPFALWVNSQASFLCFSLALPVLWCLPWLFISCRGRAQKESITSHGLFFFLLLD